MTTLEYYNLFADLPGGNILNMPQIMGPPPISAPLVIGGVIQRGDDELPVMHLVSVCLDLKPRDHRRVCVLAKLLDDDAVEKFILGTKSAEQRTYASANKNEKPAGQILRNVIAMDEDEFQHRKRVRQQDLRTHVQSSYGRGGRGGKSGRGGRAFTVQPAKYQKGTNPGKSQGRGGCGKGSQGRGRSFGKGKSRRPNNGVCYYFDDIKPARAGQTAHSILATVVPSRALKARQMYRRNS